AAWQRTWLGDETLARQTAYWRDTLAGAPALLELPTDRKRPAEQDYSGALLRLELDEALSAGLKALSLRTGGTLFMTLLAGWAIVLSRLSGQHDLVIGTPTANRRRSEVEGLIGFFVNTLALRIDVGSCATVEDLLARVKEIALGAQDHQDLPFEQVVEQLKPERSLAHTPLFQVMFAWQNTDDGRFDMEGLRTEALASPHTISKFDLTLTLREEEGRITGAFEYATALFDAATMERHAGYLRRVLEEMTADASRPPARLPLLEESERQRMLVEWNRTEAEPVDDRCLHELFEAQAERYPGAVAVEYEGQCLSYGDLNARANRLAHYLRAQGVGPDARVALCVERSLEMVVGILAVLKAGGAYVPLDPAYPAERLSHMLRDSAPALLLTLSRLQDKLPAGAVPVLCLDALHEIEATMPAANPRTQVDGANLVYVIYTSGSTGRPKGVGQTWRGLHNLLDWQLHRASGNACAPLRVLQFASISFDVSFQEIWSTLCQGGTLVLMSEERRKDLGQLQRFIVEHDIQRAFLPFAVLQQMASLRAPRASEAPAEAQIDAQNETQIETPPGRCEIITAGEALQVNDDLRALLHELGGACLYNQYGPTETHVVTQHALPTAESAAWPSLPPIGKPIANVRMYVLDAACNPVPIGVTGELYIAGAGLARGYLNQPGLTAERFVPDPFGAPGSRMYRSGDLARYRPDGAIEYIGRADTQVKLRGFRVELGEIEYLLQQHPQVREAVAVVREDRPGDKHLVAYVVGDADAEILRQYLQRHVPDHMVPTRWVGLERLPLTTNGKIDRQALPAPDAPRSAEAYVAPRNELEAGMARIWAGILRVERVGAQDNFFALGGHSLLATRLVHAINLQLPVKLTLRRLFQKPVLADLVEALQNEAARKPADDAAQGGAGTAEAADTADDGYAFAALQPDWEHRYEPFPLTDIQQAYWVGREATIGLGGVGAHGYGEAWVPAFDEERFTNALNRLIERHDMLRAIFNRDGTQQVLASVPRYAMPRRDLRGLDAERVAAALAETRERMSHQVFDAGRWPLFEFGLSVLDDGAVHLHISLDALIIDAASSQILERELMLLYENPALELPPLNLTFRDYVLAERALHGSPRHQRALRYWRERLPNLAPAPALTLVRQPETIGRPHFVRRDLSIPAARWSRMKAVASQLSVTPSVMLLTAFAGVLALWSRQPRFTLSLPLFNRLPLHPDVNTVIGDFTSVVLLEVEMAGGASFAEQARLLQDRLWQDMDHSAVSGVQLIRELSQARGVQQTAMPIVFNSTLSEMVAGEKDYSLSQALGGKPVFSITQTPQVWIDHTILEQDGKLYFNWDSIDDLFPENMIADMFAAYRDLLARLDDAQAWEASAASLLPFTRLPAPCYELTPDHGLRMHELFERQAVAAPDAVAVIAPERSLGYGELRNAARKLGARLQSHGVVPNQLVAVMMERGWEQVLGTLAILYAGGAYLPIDPALPQERVHHLLEQAAVRIVLTQSCLRERVALPEGMLRIDVDRAFDETCDLPLRPVALAETDLAYVIYTSGSTGLPKGVMIDHRGAVNTLLDMNERFDVVPADRVLAISSLSFDLSVFDFFGTLAAGAAVVILAPELARDPAHWCELLQAHGVTVWNSVPALLGMLVEYAESGGATLPSTLRLALLSGDWIPVALPARWRALLPQASVASLGGATEASIWSICYPIGAVAPEWRSIPYGKAMKNQQFHVLDDFMQSRPTWVPGHLYIGGIGLAQGYWRDKARTDASFVIHPETGERLYRTGDLGRYLPDGNIEFLGREDGQVKIQGYRIELGEIESTLEAHASVQSAAVRVIGTERQEKRLAAYVVPVEGKRDAAVLTAHLAAKLPAYMVPSSITFLDAMPLSANGKVDRGRLPDPVLAVEEAAPMVLNGPDEQRIVEIVESTLKLSGIAPAANLLNLGATSIDIVRISNALSTALQFRPRLARFMAQPTLSDLVGMYREEAGKRAIAAAAQRISSAGAADQAIDDPEARKEFKAREPGRRVFPHGAQAVALAAPDDPAFERLYSQYRSVRDFRQEPMPARDLSGLLAFLSQRQVAGQPKYLYASAGGLYPVQTYLYVKPGRVGGMPGGAYYYDPKDHRLVPLGAGGELSSELYDYFVNRPMFEGAAFSLFFIAELAAIRPLYGDKSLDFCHVEAGAMAQLLTAAAAERKIGLCGVGSVDAAPLAALFALGPTHRLIYSMIGGLRGDGAERMSQVEHFSAERSITEADAADMEEVEI
ncbi:MAG TPA: amino acid adenylation domain-containing protein, partial [Paucimonas sp.]|nr:amino acid adenylation domain-containing protein [Paucimonas sp.]